MIRNVILFVLALGVLGCAIAEQWTHNAANHAMASTLWVLVAAWFIVYFAMDD